MTFRNVEYNMYYDSGAARRLDYYIPTMTAAARARDRDLESKYRHYSRKTDTIAGGEISSANNDDAIRGPR